MPRSTAVSTAKPSLQLAVQYAADRFGDALADRAQIRRWIQAARAVINSDAAAELTIRFADVAEARALNRQHRQGDYTPNVLTFALHDEFSPQRDEAIAADIVICPQVVAREARQQRKRFIDHLAHMVIHGTLHAHGFDHLEADEATLMESIERRVLARFRIADPYDQ